MSEELADGVREALRDLVLASADGVTSSQLAEFGWHDVLAEDRRVAISTLFDEVGRSGARVAAYDALVREIVGEESAHWGIVFAGSASDDAGTVHGCSLGEVDRASVPPLLLLVDLAARSATLFDSTDVIVEQLSGVDPDSRATAVTLNRSDRVRRELDPEVSALIVSEIRRAVAYEQIGLATGLLDAATSHVSSRYQFGQPIGAYQSVQHRLADVHVAIEAAGAALETTWEQPSDLLLLTSYSLAASAADAAIRASLQVCGGMGFTEEFALSRLVRRSIALTGVFESPSAIARMIADEIGKSGHIQRLGLFHPEAGS